LTYFLSAAKERNKKKKQIPPFVASSNCRFRVLTLKHSSLRVVGDLSDLLPILLSRVEKGRRKTARNNERKQINIEI
jgi:hypothetical protein